MRVELIESGEKNLWNFWDTFFRIFRIIVYRIRRKVTSEETGVQSVKRLEGKRYSFKYLKVSDG